MKNYFKIAMLLAVIISFSSCDHIVEATDYSLHTANFYFYNYTNQEFFAKLEPTDFRAKQKFRIQKSKYIKPKYDDELLTEADFSFEWVPGDFYYNVTFDSPENNPATLRFFTSKNQEMQLRDSCYFTGVPSAQDYDIAVYIIETFLKEKMTVEEFNICMEKITDADKAALFSEFYFYTDMGYDFEMPYYHFSILSLTKNGEWVRKPIAKKNYLREIEAIVEEYDLDFLRTEPGSYAFKEETTGELSFDSKDPEDAGYNSNGDDAE